RGTFSGALTPEVGNLGMLVYHVRHFGFGPGFPRVWPATMRVAVWMTSSSGILNAVLAVQAHLDARLVQGARPRWRSPALLVLAAWILPGLGHFLQKRRLRGALVFVLLVGLFLLGSLLAHGSNLDRERHFYYWAGQFLLGAPVMLAEVVHGGARV